MRLLGGGSSLPQVVSDMNTNILRYNNEHIGPTSATVTGTAVVSATTNIDVNHGLTYIPRAEVWMLVGTAYRPLPLVLDTTLGAGITYATLFDFEVDATKLRIRMTLGSGSTMAGLRTFVYRLYRESAN